MPATAFRDEQRQLSVERKWFVTATAGSRTLSGPAAQQRREPAACSRLVIAGWTSGVLNLARHADEAEDGNECNDTHANSLISASAFSSQNRMSISRYIVVAVVGWSCACL